MTTSLDSSVLIDLMRGRAPHLRERFLDRYAGGDVFVVSAIAHHEVLYGIELCSRPDDERRRYRDLFADLRTEPFSPPDGAEAAALRAELKRAGLKLQGPDLFIAGQARARGWSVGTANLKHFTRMRDVLVEDWSA